MRVQTAGYQPFRISLVRWTSEEQMRAREMPRVIEAQNIAQALRAAEMLWGHLRRPDEMFAAEPLND